jgi:hypothetical protein
MSQVGNVEKMYGGTLNIVTTNAPGDKILDYGEEHVFTENSLIISSPVNVNGEVISDKGTPSIICVDFEGKPLRLTYTIQPGDGIVADFNNPDVIRMNIDKHTLNTEGESGDIGVPSGKLRVEVSGLIDHNTSLVNKNNNLVVNPGCFVDNHSLKTASRWYGGDSSLYDQQDASFENHKFEPNFIYINKENLCDGTTIVADTSYLEAYNNIANKETAFESTPWLANSYTKLKVNTAGLEKATNTTYGIVRADENTIAISDGVIHVITKKLDLVNEDGGYGIVRTHKKADSEDPIWAKDGYLKINTAKMTKAGNKAKHKTAKNDNVFGVCIADGLTIASDAGVLKVITESLSAPTGVKRGVVRPDGTSITSNEAGVISVNIDGLPQSSQSNYGVVKIDGRTIKHNKVTGEIYVDEYANYNNSIEELRELTARQSEDINELRTQIANLTAQLNNKMATIFGLYTNETRNKQFTSISLIRNWNAKDGGYASVGVGSSTIITEYFYIDYKPGVALTWNISNFKSWITIETLTFYGADQNSTNLVTMANTNVVFKSSSANDLYKVAVRIRVTKPSTAQSSNGTLNFYGPDGTLLQAIPVNFKYIGGDYTGSIGSPKTNDLVTNGTINLKLTENIANKLTGNIASLGVTEMKIK